MFRTKKWLWNIISSGLPSDSDIDVLRKVVLLNTTIFFGGACLFLLTIIAAIEGDFVLTAADAVWDSAWKGDNTRMALPRRC